MNLNFIRSDESRRLILRTLLLFFLCVAYCILRNLKDAITLSAASSSAEVIPFLKVWGMLPAAFLMTWAFTTLSQRYSRRRVFHLFLISFLAYYLCFAFVMYPLRETLRWDSAASILNLYLPHGLNGFVLMVQNWAASSFYVMSELWATAMVAILYWGFINESSSPEEAGRSYGILKIGATASAFAAGNIAAALTQNSFDPSFPFGHDIWEQTLIKQTLMVTFLGVLSLALFRYLYSQSTPKEKRESRKKERMNLAQSLRYVMQSPYLLCIALTVLGYNLVFNMADILWKEQVRLAFPNPNDLMAYMNKITAWVGFFSVIAALSSPYIVSRFGWRLLAGATPAVMLCLAVPFFGLLLFGDSPFSRDIGFATLTATPMVLGIGAVQNCLSKAAKYSVFDVSKEMGLTVLDSQSRWSAKAAIDGVGNDIGKTGSSLTHQALLLFFGNLSASTPFVATLVLAVLVLWLAAVLRASQEYELRTEGVAEISGA